MEISRSTEAFPRGLGSFSPAGITAHPRVFCSRFYRAAVRIPPRTSAFAAARLPVFPPTHAEVSQGPTDQILSGGEAAPREALRLPLGGLRGDGPRSTVILGLSGLPEGGRIPPGGYPLARSSAFASDTRGIGVRFPCTGQRAERCGGL